MNAISVKIIFSKLLEDAIGCYELRGKKETMDISLASPKMKEGIVIIFRNSRSVGVHKPHINRKQHYLCLACAFLVLKFNYLKVSIIPL